MIENLTEKQLKKYQSLVAWKDFYVECSNEWETIKIDHKIERFEIKYFE